MGAGALFSGGSFSPVSSIDGILVTMSMLQRWTFKWTTMRRWLFSSRGVQDWPAAFLLGIFRTRPSVGTSLDALFLKWLFPRLRVRPKRLNGYKVSVSPSTLANLIIYEEIFLGNAYDLSLVEFSPDMVIDCGAYEGYFTLLAKAHFKDIRCIAFEPSRDNYRALLSNFKLNEIGDVDARNEAVSVWRGESAFSGCGFGGHLSCDETHALSGSVTVSDLRDFVEGAQRLLLKVDIEGEEKVVLPATLDILPETCAIFFEWHHGEDDYLRMEETLKTAGFSTMRLRTWVPGDNGVVFVDAFAQRFEDSAPRPLGNCSPVVEARDFL
jgi:FkbM family methyltransferase